MGCGLFAIASVSAHIACRQVMTSPILASTPRNPMVPAVSVALIISPVMKSSLTASRVQPCNWNRGTNPLRGKKVLAFSMSP